MEIEVFILNLILDPVNKSPIVILKERAGKRFLPIWIGFPEANAIAIVLEGIVTPRPLTHDLFKNSIEKLGYKISRVVIDDLKDNTYYAHIYFINIETDEEIGIDARPSDAIALALRFKAPIFADENLLKDFDKEAVLDEKNMEDLKKWLEEIDPELLGKYEM